MCHSPQREVKIVVQLGKGTPAKARGDTKRNENTGRSEIIEMVIGQGLKRKDTGKNRRKTQRAKVDSSQRTAQKAQRHRQV